MPYCAYMLANRRNGTLYIGVTSDLVQRMYEHREGLADGFTKQYRCKQLVWFETTDCVEAAISREKQLKNWKRPWKIALIEKTNPTWRDLYGEILGIAPKGRPVVAKAQEMGPGSRPG